MQVLTLTGEQSKEIAKIIYPYDGLEIYDFDVSFHEYDRDMYEDAREYVEITFNAEYHGEARKWRVEIFTNLDCTLHILSVHDGSAVYRPEWCSLHPFHQYDVQKKFREWGIYPNKTEEREEEIKKLLE